MSDFNKILTSICLIIALMMMLSSCAAMDEHMAERIKEINVDLQSTFPEYCEKHENDMGRAIRLLLVETFLRLFNIDLDLRRGMCEDYYLERDKKRNMYNGAISKKGAYSG